MVRNDQGHVGSRRLVPGRIVDTNAHRGTPSRGLAVRSGRGCAINALCLREQPAGTGLHRCGCPSRASRAREAVTSSSKPRAAARGEGILIAL